MLKFRTGVILIIALCITLCGCHSTNAKKGQTLNLAQELHIDCYYRENHLQRTYTDSDKIDIILKYLHQLSIPGQSLQSPENLSGDRCKIIVNMWNGTQHSYEIQNKEYLRINSKDWYAADTEKANIIYHLVNHIESDEKTAH